MQAFLVLLRYDLGQMARSWIVRAWVSLLVVPAVILSFLSALGIFFSTVFRNAQLAILAVMALVLFSGAILQFLGLKWMSTTAILNELPTTFQGGTSFWTTLRVLVIFTALTTAA